MSDLETRLRAALSAGTSSPPPTVGLAAAARQRLRRRRRTRGVVGGVLAVLLVGVPVGVVARDGSRSPDVVRPVEPDDSWRTETWRGLSVDVPAAWERGDACDTPVPVVDASGRQGPGCGSGADALGVVFVDLTDTIFRSVLRPGEVVELDGRWTGYAFASDDRGPSAWVTADDREVVQRVLDSARPAASDDGWRTETGGDLTLDVPADWLTGDTCGNTGAPVVTVAEEWGCAVTGYGVRFAPYPALGTLATTAEMQRAEGPSWPAGSWWANVQVPGSTYVASVVTADRATGQRILDSARRGPALDEWRTESWNGLSVEVPASWEQGDRRVWCTRGAATRGAVEWPGTLDKQPRCGRPQYGFGVTFGPAGAFDPVYESGRVWQYERGDVEMYVDGSWLGFWYDEDRLVQVNAGDRETVQRILDSLQVQPGRQ